MKGYKLVGTLLFIGYCLLIFSVFYKLDKGLFTIFISMGTAVYMISMKKLTKKWQP